MRAAVGLTRMPLSIASVRTPCTIGNVPALLRSISSGADTHRCHDRAEDTKVRGREGLDQVCEMRQEGSLAAHEIDERFLCSDDKVRLPGDRHGVEEDGDVHGGCRIAAEHPGLELADKALDGLRPDRVANHDVPGAGRETKPVQGAGKGLAELREVAVWNLLGKKKGVVLVSPHGLLATPFRTHQQQAAILSDGRWGHHLKELSEQPSVQVGGDFGDQVNLQPLPMEPLDLALDVASRARQVVEVAGAINSSRDELGVAGQQPQDVDVLEEADIIAVRPDCETPLVVLRHQKQRVENEVAPVDRDNIEMADLPDRRVERKSTQDDRFRQVHARDHANPLSIPHEKGIDVVVPHAVPGLLDGGRAIDKDGAALPRLADARPQHALDALCFPLLGKSIELAGYIRIEKGREGCVVTDEIKNNVAGDQDSRASPPPRRSLHLPPRAQRRASRNCLSGRARPGACLRPEPRRLP